MGQGAALAFAAALALLTGCATVERGTGGSGPGLSIPLPDETPAWFAEELAKDVQSLAEGIGALDEKERRCLEAVAGHWKVRRRLFPRGEYMTAKQEARTLAHMARLTKENCDRRGNGRGGPHVMAGFVELNERAKAPKREASEAERRAATVAFAIAARVGGVYPPTPAVNVGPRAIVGASGGLVLLTPELLALVEAVVAEGLPEAVLAP